jgi:hypothetical protein
VIRTALIVLALAASCATFSGCETQPRRTTANTRSYPVERRPPQPELHDKDQNPNSQAWPLDRWLVEFENRNGVELKYREQDTFGHEVIQPGPGPFDTDQEALDALRRVLRKSRLTLIEIGPHIYRIKRVDGSR